MSFLCHQADAVSYSIMLTLCGSNIDKHWTDGREIFELSVKHGKV